MRAKSRSEHKMAIRQEARQKVRGGGNDLASQKKFASDVQRQHDHLIQRSNEGGDGHTKAIRNELTYLINNYIPKFDTRIEKLIDDWRRSGDPDYDPGIRLKLRQCRREQMSKGNPY